MVSEEEISEEFNVSSKSSNSSGNESLNSSKDFSDTHGGNTLNNYEAELSIIQDKMKVKITGINILRANKKQFYFIFCWW